MVFNSVLQAAILISGRAVTNLVTNMKKLAPISQIQAIEVSSFQIFITIQIFITKNKMTFVIRNSYYGLNPTQATV